MLRLATPIVGIRNICKFKHYKMPLFCMDASCSYFLYTKSLFLQIDSLILVIATVVVYCVVLRNMGAFLCVFIKPGWLNIIKKSHIVYLMLVFA